MKTLYFNFGEVYMTAGVQTELDMDEVLQLLTWHGQLKGGDLCEADQNMNRMALNTGDRILSRYTLHGNAYYVITESDRSITTVLKVEEY